MSGALWSWWASPCVHQEMSEQQWTKHAIQQCIYSFYFLPWTLAQFVSTVLFLRSASFVRLVVKLPHTTHITSQKRLWKVSVSNHLHEIMYTDTLHIIILLLFHPLLHHATIIAAQMAAPVYQQIFWTSSCNLWMLCCTCVCVGPHCWTKLPIINTINTNFLYENLFPKPQTIWLCAQLKYIITLTFSLTWKLKKWAN